MPANEEQATEAHCNTCLRETSHRVLASNDQNGPEYDDQLPLGYEWIDTYQILECCGCHCRSFRRIYREEIDYLAFEPLREEPGWAGLPDVPPGYRRVPGSKEEMFKLPEGADVDDDLVATWIYQYPPPVARAKPAWLSHIPDSIKSVLKEVYVATAADVRCVAAMGLRAVIDAVCTDKVGDVGGFKEKLKALGDGEFVSSRERDILEAALETAHAAAHRAHRPSTDELSRLLDIVEHMLQAMYVLPDVAEELKKKAPKRQKPT